MPSKVLKRTHETSPTDGIDIYLVISRAVVASQTPLGQFDGLGIATASVFGHSAGTVQAGFVITLVDARTFKTVDSTIGQIPTDGLFGRGPPVKAIDVSGWPDSYEALSPDQWTKIHNELQSLVSDALSFSLPRIKFPS
jgi:hypothetical protein